MTVKLTLRVPGNLHAAIEVSAEADRRSLNSMIVVLVEEALRARDAGRPAGTERPMTESA